jgi:hypothetical protein
MKKIAKKQGYSVLELVFYVSLVAVLSIALINSILTMMKSFKLTTQYSQIQDGGAIMERMSREIRQSLDINSLTSTSLTLDTVDDTGTSKTIQFLQSGTNLQLLENTTLTGNLNSPGILVNSLSFTPITTAHGQAVKISMGLVSTSDTAAQVYNFYDTVVLRGNY